MQLSDAVISRIEELKKEYGWTQYKLSEVSGVPQTTLISIKRNSLIIRKNTNGHHHIIPHHCNWKEIRSECDFEYQNTYPIHSKPDTLHTVSLCFRTHCREHVRFLQPGQVYFAGCW